jgi:hypothetical protein
MQYSVAVPHGSAELEPFRRSSMKRFTRLKPLRVASIAVAVSILFACAATGIPRTVASDAHALVSSGEALLVCAYGSEEKCQDKHLEGSISLVAFKLQAASLPRDQELIFYCS